jgi:hemoglobin
VNTDSRVVRDHLVTWLCVASGGPCRYAGRRLALAHAGMGIDDEHFDAFVEAFTKALNRFNVKGRDKVELVLLLRRAHEDVVGR